MEGEIFRQLLLANLHGTVLEALGIEIVSWEPDAFSLAISMDGRHRQPEGFLHGGVSALLAESAASFAAAASVDIYTNVIFGVDLNITHLRPRRNGRIIATARPLYRGRTTHVYTVDITDGEGEPIAAARCTIAIRPRPELSPTT